MDDDVLAAVLRQVQQRAGGWFGTAERGHATVRLLGRAVRPRCFLYRLEVDDGHMSRRVVVKVRHSIAGLRRRELFEDLPVLAPDRTLPDIETAHREYVALREIDKAFTASGDARFGVLRALDWFSDTGAIVLPEVQEPTLHDVLLGGSLFLGRAAVRPTEDQWRNVGAWLRRWHSVQPVLPTMDRQPTRADLVQLLDDYGRFLSARTGRVQYFSALVGAATRWAERELPSTLTLVNAHGDFVSRNAFVGQSGRVTVFDALMLWRAPEYEDIARMTMTGLRLVNSQILSQGLLLPGSRVDAYEAAFLGGYYGDAAVPVPQVRLYQLVLLLDRWVEVVGKASRRPSRRPSRRAVVALGNRYLRRQAGRLMSQATLEGPAPARTSRQPRAR